MESNYISIPIVGSTNNVFTYRSKREIVYYSRVVVVVIMVVWFLAKFHVPGRPTAAAICSGHTLVRLDTQLPILYTCTTLISNNYVNVSRGGGGVNTFFVGRRLAGMRAGGHPRGTALLTCRFGIKWTCNTPCSNRFHIASLSTSSEPPPWVALSHLNRHNTVTTYTHT